MKLAERAEPELHGSKQAEWLIHLEREHDNLSAALTWGLEAEGAADALFRLAAALVWFWIVRGFFGEGQDWLERCLKEGDGEARHRAKILNGSGILAYLQADYTRSRAQQEEALATFRMIGDKQGIADSLLGLGNVAAAQGDYALANERYEEALRIFRESHDKRGIADSFSSCRHHLNKQKEKAYFIGDICVGFGKAIFKTASARDSLQSISPKEAWLALFCRKHNLLSITHSFLVRPKRDTHCHTLLVDALSPRMLPVGPAVSVIEFL